MGKILNCILTTFIVLMGLSACGNSECYDNQSTLPLAGFYSMQTKSKITVDSLTVYAVGAPGDTLLIDNSRGEKLYMPFPLSGNSTTYVFHYNQKGLNFIELNDSITFNYEGYPQFVSNECGVIYKYKVKDFSYTKHLIDSVAIPIMEFNNKDIENIQIYFRTATE